MNRLFLVAVPVVLAGLLVGPLPVGAISASSNVIITADRVIEEDLFAAAGRRVIVEGTIRGDLTVVTHIQFIHGITRVLDKFDWDIVRESAGILFQYDQPFAKAVLAIGFG